MRFAPYLLLPFALVIAVPFAGCGDETSGPSGDGGKPIPCNNESDCDDDNGCTFDFCIDGLCTHDFDNGDDPEAEQITGDCMVFECSQGESTLVVDVDDIPDDPNEADCSVPSCSAEGMPIEIDAEDGAYCENNGAEAVCTAGMTCSCTAPTGPDSQVFVDPVEGSDTPTNGGARGACAYKTLDYALTQATGEIRLAFQDYTTADATFPIVLTGDQWINCPYDDQNNISVKLIGNGDFNGLTTVVAFNGTRNGINDCEIDAEGVATHGVVIATTSVGDNHFLDRANIHSAVSDGVVFLDAANGFNAYQSTITGNGAAGINFGAMPRNGYFQENEWTGNTGSDVLCGDPSPGLNGQNNNIGTCVGCDNCPF